MTSDLRFYLTHPGAVRLMQYFGLLAAFAAYATIYSQCVSIDGPSPAATFNLFVGLVGFLAIVLAVKTLWRPGRRLYLFLRSV